MDLRSIELHNVDLHSLRLQILTSKRLHNDQRQFLRRLYQEVRHRQQRGQCQDRRKVEKSINAMTKFLLAAEDQYRLIGGRYYRLA